MIVNCIISYQFFLGMMKMIAYIRIVLLRKRVKLFLYLKKLLTAISWRYSLELCITKIKYYTLSICIEPIGDNKKEWKGYCLTSGRYLRPAIYIEFVLIFSLCLNNLLLGGWSDLKLLELVVKSRS
jgi:hypothetical protein